jgi:hypothetical protein
MFICGLFNDAVIIPGCIEFDGMINELERIWKGEVVVSFRVLCRNFPGGTEKNTKNIS